LGFHPRAGSQTDCQSCDAGAEQKSLGHLVDSVPLARRSEPPPAMPEAKRRTRITPQSRRDAEKKAGKAARKEREPGRSRGGGCRGGRERREKRYRLPSGLLRPPPLRLLHKDDAAIALFLCPAVRSCFSGTIQACNYSTFLCALRRLCVHPQGRRGDCTFPGSVARLFLRASATLR
jgi:hypothetical protein